MPIAYKFCFLSFLLYFFAFLRMTETYSKITNIECKTFDKPFADIPICRLRVIKRGVIALNIHVKLYQLPVHNVSVNLSFWKKASGYRPFLYNMSSDFCAFMVKRKRYPFFKLFHDVLMKNSNANHTCPYDHDIIVKNLIVNDDMFDKFPVPPGEYLFKLLVGAYNEWKAEIKAYLSLSLKSEF